MLKFYKTTCIPITNATETDSNEQNISVSVDAGVLLKFHVPAVAAGIRIYRSTVADAETLLIDIPLPDELRKKPIVAIPFSFRDTGDLSPGVITYPLTNGLNNFEQEAIPTPVFTLEEVDGSLPADTYYYRVSFYSVVDVAPAYTEKDVYIKFYTPDVTEVMLYTREDMTSELNYTLVSDPFAYIELIRDDLLFTGVNLGVESFYAQQLNIGGELVKKYIYQQIPVIMSLSDPTYLIDKPVIMNLVPNDVEVEVIENLLIGPAQYFSGVVSKVFSEPGSVVYFPSERSKFLFAISGGSFKVVS